MVFTDGHKSYDGVSHSVGHYVHGMAHTNGIEAFWSILKRGYVGTYHWMSPKHLHRYVSEFAGRHNLRPKDTDDQLGLMIAGMEGRQLPYRKLVG